MSNKHKHLDLVSGAISRMAQNSFTVRGWCITVVTAIIAFGVDAENAELVTAALVPILLFWIVDAYYLQQERAFRRLYDVVRSLHETDIDFDMSPVHTQSLIVVFFKPSLTSGLYLGLSMIAIAIATWL